MSESNPVADTPATTPWTYDGVPAAVGGPTDGVTTLVEGDTFCLADQNGNISAERPHGLFVLDTRVLSHWSLTINGMVPESLGIDLPAPFQAKFVGRVVPPASSGPDSSLLVVRQRSIGNGMRETVTVRNVGLEPVGVRIGLTSGVDFANLFEVKEGRVQQAAVAPIVHSSTSVYFRRHHVSTLFETSIEFSEPATFESGEAVWTTELANRDEFAVCIEVVPGVNGSRRLLRFTCDESDDPVPTTRLTQWRSTAPIVRSDSPALDAAVRRGIEDLGALRIFDPARSDRPVIAAGAPWFMALFGRDSLLTAWMSLLVNPDLAIGVVQALAGLQGRDTRPETEEEPGKILHEARFSAASDLSLYGGAPYYGSVDATPLFVMLVGELNRWGADPAVMSQLMPHVDAALRWIDEYGDRDGDGYVEYQRSTVHGLANQGWKDSWDGVPFADARLAEAPIALCEVQGYVYGAFRARAELAGAEDDLVGERYWSDRAERLRVAFNRDFWLEERGRYALGLDGHKRPIDALASNPGHCLWTGIVDDEHAAAVARSLLSPEMFTGWGIRTLASSMSAYNPLSYHNGSVWPHDTALCAAGLMRYGHVSEAHDAIEALVAASAHSGGRLPELFSGLDRRDIGIPIAYPTSCSPQAWAAASPLLLVRTLLRLDPDVQHRRLWIAPVLPDAMRSLHVDGIVVAGHRISVHIDGSRVEIDGADDLTVAPVPRHR